MSELGYYEPIPGIYGTDNPATDSDPIARAALQEASVQANILASKNPGSVPQCYAHLGSGNPVVVGWTAQKDAGKPVFPPYTAEGTGVTPDWTADANPIGAGTYDMNPEIVAAPNPNTMNQGPIGGSTFDGWEGEPPNPNVLPYDVGGSIGGDLDY